MTESISRPPLPPGSTAPWGEERQWIVARSSYLADRVAVVAPHLAGARDVEWVSTAASSFVAVIEDLASEIARLGADIADLEDAAAWLCAAGAEAESSLDAASAAIAVGAAS